MVTDLKGTNVEHGAALMKADAARLEISPLLDPARRAKLGQFLTPAIVAEFMARMVLPLPMSVRLLDAGAGAGSLTAAFVKEVSSRSRRPGSLEVSAFEIDSSLHGHLEQTLNACSLECHAAGMQFISRVIHQDFVENAATLFDSQRVRAEYDCALLNPPYAKIGSTSTTRYALRQLGVETSNLYSAFVAVALSQLKTGGQLIAITPRSFCNGPYFGSFRKFILRHAGLVRAHVYLSRKTAFGEDDVLQENIIYHLVKGIPQPSTVRISSSLGPRDTDPVEHEVPFTEVVLPNDPHKFIRLVSSAEDSQLAQRVRGLPCSLAGLGLKVSTGRVVDFRAREHLRDDPMEGAVPLIYPCHFEQGFVKWPQSGCRKPNALALSGQTMPLTVPKGSYVLTKRFSSKEERRRIVAAVYDPRRIDAALVGFENHLNYFHREGSGLRPALAKGLALYLNSTAVDQYFRQFSGHTQVNATDLRALHYPSIDQLEAIGRIMDGVLPSQRSIDEAVEELLPTTCPAGTGRSI